MSDPYGYGIYEIYSNYAEPTSKSQEINLEKISFLSAVKNKFTKLKDKLSNFLDWFDK